MHAIDTKYETRRLEEAFNRMITELAPNAGDVSTKLMKRLGLRPGAKTVWTERFSPLTALYPMLQAQGIEAIPETSARRVTLAHLCLMIHSFVEDRQLDGQFTPTNDEYLFSKNMLLKGLAIARTVANHEGTYERHVDRLMAAYSHSQSEQSRTKRPFPSDLENSRVTRIATGRAAFGSIAITATACGSGCDEGMIQSIHTAFDALVTALQWADDIEDWDADLRTGDENFLLTRLWSLEPELMSADRDTIGAALTEHGAAPYAVEQAQYWVDTALRLQREMECTQLAQLIDTNFEPLKHAESRLQNKIDKSRQIAAVKQ